MLPVLRETDGVAAMESAPRRTKTDVDHGVVDAAVVIELADDRRLPWRTADEEPVLVIANTCCW